MEQCRPAMLHGAAQVSSKLQQHVNAQTNDYTSGDAVPTADLHAD